jgi:hypothetical protein
MKIRDKNLNVLIANQGILEDTIEKTKRDYRPFDPGQYLYNLLMDKREHLDVFTDEYIELLYTTLIAWNLNSRSSRLVDMETFKRTIKASLNKIISLKDYRIEDLTDNEKAKVLEILQQLFKEMKLSQTKAKLIIFSKTMHFLLPNLVVPIDRKFALNFFYGDITIPLSSDAKKNDEAQFEIFKELFEMFMLFAKRPDLNKYLDKKWNRNVPRLIENIIISFKNHKKI